MTLISQANLFAPEQFRMHRLQVFNWGTFSGLHDIPISERGFLFVGRSGAGKSTLLDALSALLIPPKWVDFNAAARELDKSGRDRNFASYIRGAWADQKDNDSGEIATQYLRNGTTWSALALSYRNPQGQTVVLVQLFWLRGKANSNAEVKRHFFIFERPFELSELQHFDLNIRALKQSFPEAHAYDEFRPYCERLCRLLGIETEMALRLLHKTQSAKNLGDLNTLLRDFMLDKPETFEVAERLVAEFAELNTAHQAVITAREQVEILAPALKHHHQWQLLQLERSDLEELRQGLDGYRQTQRKLLLEDAIKLCQIQADSDVGAASSASIFLDSQISHLRNLENQQRDMGGNQIELWEDEKKRITHQLSERERKKQQTEEACSRLKMILPTTSQAFAEFVGQAREELINGQEYRNQTRQEQFSLVGSKNEAEVGFAAARKEIDALRRQTSNIPAEMSELRRDIAIAIGLHESALPFVGELVEVKQQETAWQGAIERVMRSFALSLLVEDKHYAALSKYINTTTLGKRLVYFRVINDAYAKDRTISPLSLVHKLNIKEGRYSSWLGAELKQRFDFTCVDTMQAFRNAQKALTREGQIRHGLAKHEKDDRYRVDDRSKWILGFDNREKLSLFEQQAHDLAKTIASLNQSLNLLSEKEQERTARDLQYQLLTNIAWHEIDTAPLGERLIEIDQLLLQFRANNSALQSLETQIAAQNLKRESAEQNLRSINVRQTVTQTRIAECEKKLASVIASLHDSLLTNSQLNGLSARFENHAHKLTLENIDDIARNIERKLVDEIAEISKKSNNLVKAIENLFADFKRNWPMESSDLDTSINSAPDFSAKLKRLETDGLPAHEQRFFDLLQTQSNQNLAALATHLTQARKAITERMQLVNASLSQAEFSPGTYLAIDVSDKHLPEVREFKQHIQEVLSGAWSENREHAENRFLVLSKLVEKLGSQEGSMRNWRDAVLDVRQHVEFIGRECDEHNREVEVYRSGAGKSGGQRQKLAATCLAAALRYQLGGSDHHVPIYAAVVLDEAFDKADNEFTALAMNIFTNFGFQMIVATPLKSVMTLEPFIGGACFVDIRDRKHSSVLSLSYDETQQRLTLMESPNDHSTTDIS
jgi:uncharacterized protein YPO0396